MFKRKILSMLTLCLLLLAAVPLTAMAADAAYASAGCRCKEIATHKASAPASTALNTAKQPQTISFAESDVSKTFGDGKFTNAISRTAGNGAMTYSSSDSAIASVDENGEVTIKGVGTVTITAAADETEDYLASEASYQLNIVHKTIQIPATDDTMYIYNGSPQTYHIAESEYYTVTGNTQTNVGMYGVTVALTDKANTKWPHGNTDNLSFVFHIYTYSVPIPEADPAVFTYNGSEQTYAIAESPYYTVTGNAHTDAGIYTVTVELNDKVNTKWLNSSTENLTYEFVINKAVVEMPEGDDAEFIYNGLPQTYRIDESPYYTATGNTQTNAGSHTFTVALNNPGNYEWSDGSSDNLSFWFVISRATITITARNKSAFVGDAVPALGESDYIITGLAAGDTLKTAPTIAYAETPNMATAGSVDIVVSGAEVPEGENYSEIEFENGTLTISSRPANGGGGISVPPAPAPEPESDPASPAEWDNPFTDVAEEDWFYGAVEFANQNGLFSGTGDTTFSPDSTMTRAMLWTVLGRLNGEALSGSDVYENARSWAMDTGITDGTSPEGSITREQLVTILWRYAGSPKAEGSLSAFADADSVSRYAADAMAWAVENGIIEGSGGALMPQGDATRAQVAAIMQRFAEKIR